jgi:predicted TIM-barrel fold metal-dependent hydrolase
VKTVIDINAFLGHWPFRRLRDNRAPDLVALMDRKGINVAIVSSLDAILYKNCQAANEDLILEIAPYRERLIPFATVNPTYAAWEEDVAHCQEALGMKGLRIFPAYHGYTLRDRACERLMALARERDLAVALPLRMEDRRQQHWMDTAEDIPPQEVGALAGRFPDVKLMVLNGIGDPVDWATFKDASVLVDLSRLTHLRLRPPPHDVSIPALVEHLGADKLAFGSGIPISYPDPALLKVDIMDTDEEVREKLRWRNAARMLGLSVQLPPA